jgi:hypothetical protein
MTTAKGDLPNGTLTFLFTDIEGSTRLASQLGLQFSAQLAQHNRIVRDAISANHGTVSSTAGDSFFATFPDAASAVVAAVAAQRGLHAFAWAGDPIRVRMGLHTADRTADDEGIQRSLAPPASWRPPTAGKSSCRTRVMRSSPISFLRACASAPWGPTGSRTSRDQSDCTSSR